MSRPLSQHSTSAATQTGHVPLATKKRRPTVRSLQFCFADKQVQRGHLISHLPYLPEQEIRRPNRLHKRHRTHCPNEQLSENIDLIAISDRTTVADNVVYKLCAAAGARSHPQTTQPNPGCSATSRYPAIGSYGPLPDPSLWLEQLSAGN